MRRTETGLIDERDDVTFVNARIKIGIQLGDGSRNLRAYLDGDHRVDGAGGFDDIINLAVLYASVVVGGALLIVYAISMIIAPSPPGDAAPPE